MSLTEKVASWVADNSGLLSQFDDVILRRFGVDSDKPSVHLLLELGPRIAEILVWDSGEIEIIRGTPGDHHDEHREIEDPNDVYGILEELTVLLRGG
jgi:hypothetical protein